MIQDIQLQHRQIVLQPLQFYECFLHGQTGKIQDPEHKRNVKNEMIVYLTPSKCKLILLKLTLFNPCLMLSPSRE